MDAIAETKERPHAEILGPDAAFLRRNRLAGVIAQHLSRANQDGEPGPALSHDRPPGTGDFELCAGETDTDLGAVGIEFILYEFAKHVGGPMRSEKHTSELQSLMRNSYA